MDKFIKENWFKLSVVIIIAAVGSLVAYNYIRTLTKKEDLELQAMCAKKAELFFEKNGYLQQGSQGDFYQYTCHYNKKLNKCFISIRGALLGGQVGNAFYLYDVYENKMYADYYNTVESKSGVKLEDTPPQNCSLLDRPSHLKEEYDTFIKPYMEENF